MFFRNWYITYKTLFTAIYYIGIKFKNIIIYSIEKKQKKSQTLKSLNKIFKNINQKTILVYIFFKHSSISKNWDWML